MQLVSRGSVKLTNAGRVDIVPPRTTTDLVCISGTFLVTIAFTLHTVSTVGVSTETLITILDSSVLQIYKHKHSNTEIKVKT